MQDEVNQEDSEQQWRQSWWGPGVRTSPTFSPARVRILVDPGSIFTKLSVSKSFHQELATSYSFFDPKQKRHFTFTYLVTVNKYSDSKF